ncbi:gas vesicle protein [Plantactinospora solaniradicis]|uniref:Gas vesicle protein n=1 Tax=Plantactinospora solaniradicis TaxID=1723736 RepID=A0ABW1KKC5_9ACTN
MSNPQPTFGPGYGPLAPGPGRGPAASSDAGSLADILERVLDRGVVIAGDIRVNLLDIELLTIKLRLVVASVDTARQMGIDWWEHDPFLGGRPQRSVEPDRRQRARPAPETDRTKRDAERTDRGTEEYR